MAVSPTQQLRMKLKQLTYLHLATLQPFAAQSDNQHRRDNWAANLLQRYMRASGHLSENEIRGASLADLRMVMSTVLNVFDAARFGNGREWLESFSRDDALPAGFDNDLYPGLGWDYGLFLAKAFRRYKSQGLVSKTLAHQWLKQCTMWD